MAKLLHNEILIDSLKLHYFMSGAKHSVLVLDVILRIQFFITNERKRKYMASLKSK